MTIKSRNTQGRNKEGLQVTVGIFQEKVDRGIDIGILQIKLVVLIEFIWLGKGFDSGMLS
jgi:hypothetical protein